jgi:hypothetical protein
VAQDPLEIKLEKFEELRAAPKRNGRYEPAPRVRSPFSPETFDLLAGLHDDPTKTYYQEHREGIRDHVEEPFRRLVRNVAKRVRAPITGLMEIDQNAEDLSNRHRTSHNAAAKINGHPADAPLVRGD